MAMQDFVSTMTSVARHFEAAADSSFVRIAQRSIIEPIVFVQENVMLDPELPNLMGTIHNIFTGYFLLSWQALNIQVNNVTVDRLMEQFNPDKSRTFNMYGLDLAASTHDHYNPEGYVEYSSESMKYSLPDYSKVNIALEAPNDRDDDDKDDDDNNNNNNNNRNRGRGNGQGPNVNYNEVMKAYNQDNQLALGKLITLDVVSDRNQKANLTCLIRLRAIPVRAGDLAIYLTKDQTEYSFKERWHKFRAGRLKFWRDLVFGQDLIDKYIKRGLSTSRALRAADRNSNISQIEAFIKGRAQVGAISNIVIIDKATANQIEADSMQKLSNPAARTAIFNDTGVMLLVIIDRDKQMVTIYTRGYADASVLTFRDVKTSARSNNGTDILQFLQEYTKGSSPQF